MRTDKFWDKPETVALDLNKVSAVDACTAIIEIQDWLFAAIGADQYAWRYYSTSTLLVHFYTADQATMFKLRFMEYI